MSSILASRVLAAIPAVRSVLEFLGPVTDSIFIVTSHGVRFVLLSVVRGGSPLTTAATRWGSEILWGTPNRVSSEVE